MALEIANLNVSVGKTHILHDVNLRIEAGEFFCFLGSSGCGKSTLLKTIGGFMQEQTGTIMFDDLALHELSPQKRGTIIVFQDIRLFTNMTVGENVAYPLRVKKVRKAERLARADEYLAQVQLEGFGKRYVDELSGGQAQRVAIARALACEPRVLLLDEPFSSLDENLRDDMRQLVLDIHRRTGLTTIMVTHDQREALAMADRIAVMDAGRIVQVGTPEEVYGRPASLSIARYFADGDVLAGTVEGGVFRAGGLSFPTDLGAGPAVAVVRENAVASGEGGLFVAEAVEYHGQTYRVTFANDGARLHLTLPEGERIAVGDSMRLSVDAQRVLVFESSDAAHGA